MKKINTILFDLDGTLLKFKQTDFIEVYFKKLGKVFASIDMDVEKSIKAVWAGTKAMVLNDGACLNHERFWEAFSQVLSLPDEKQKLAESKCDEFYTKDFDEVKSVLAVGSTGADNVAKRLVQDAKNKGYTVALATNPLFPECAIETRLSWIGLKPSDFTLVTHYSNSSFCKPNPGYYEEVLSKINKKPEECLMVGNNVAEDMCAKALGMEVFLVNEYIENEAGLDISEFKQGTLDDFYANFTLVGF